MGLLRASELASKLAGLQELPGIEEDSPEAQDDLRKMETTHGLEGRLRRPAMVGARAKGLQGPRAYAPRLSKS